VLAYGIGLLRLCVHQIVREIRFVNIREEMKREISGCLLEWRIQSVFRAGSCALNFPRIWRI
jgi:hypothetical protein